MGRSKNGEALSRKRTTGVAIGKLHGFRTRANAAGNLAAWRRAQAVLGYIEGTTVIALSGELNVTRGSINRWLQWYEAAGLEGLKTRKPPGPSGRLSEEQHQELAALIDAGPQLAGFTSGLWTGPMIGVGSSAIGFESPTTIITFRVFFIGLAFQYSGLARGSREPTRKRRRSGSEKRFQRSKKSRRLPRRRDFRG